MADVNLRMDFNARLCASEFCPSENGHTEINGRGVDGIEPAMQFKLLCDTLGLGNGYHMKSKLLEDMVVSEKIGFRKYLPVDTPKPRCLDFFPWAVVISVSSLRVPQPISWPNIRTSIWLQ